MGTNEWCASNLKSHRLRVRLRLLDGGSASDGEEARTNPEAAQSLHPRHLLFGDDGVRSSRPGALGVTGAFSKHQTDLFASLFDPNGDDSSLDPKRQHAPACCCDTCRSVDGRCE